MITINLVVLSPVSVWLGLLTLMIAYGMVKFLVPV